MAGFDCTVSGICTLDASAGSAAFSFPAVGAVGFSFLSCTVSVAFTGCYSD